MSVPGELNELASELELGELLATAVRGVLKAQKELDDSAAAQQDLFVHAPEGTRVLPPLWFTFQRVQFEIELSASLQTVETPAAAPEAKFLCRTLTPAGVALYGRQAAAGMRVQVELAPNGFLPLPPAPDSAAAQADSGSGVQEHA